jgi:hypothetical protein
MLGKNIVADCVNPVQKSRAGWAAVAMQAKARLVDVMLHCSDIEMHRRRVEGRRADIPGLVPPAWERVLACGFEPHGDAHIVLDSAEMTPEALAEKCLDYIASAGG